MKRKPNLTKQSHSFIEKHFLTVGTLPRVAIDATCGNGFDTVFLAKLASEKVLAFDIQKIALKKTREQLEQYNLEHKVKLIHKGHENMAEYVSSPVDVIMFNLGYLPQAKKEITTKTDSTLIALNSALALLNSNGILSILCYPGHAEGKHETIAVLKLLKELPTEFQYKEIQAEHPNERSPILLLASRHL